MKVSGFTFIRNAIKFDYPIAEAIQSILPICDEVVVAVGNSEDGTRELVASLGPKVKIIDTVWDDNLREGGQVLAEETNKALDAIDPQADWAFYIQGDEVLHEQYLPEVERAMRQWKNHQKVEGLVFNYLHFYGSYDYVADSRNWYRREIRVIRPNAETRSYRDAQGFRKAGQKLWVKPVNATIHHYGWVKDPRHQQAKQESFHKLWHSDEAAAKRAGSAETFDYSGSVSSLKPFDGTHPAVMAQRLERLNWKLNFDTNEKRYNLKTRFLMWVEKLTGWRMGEYRNYRIF